MMTASLSSLSRCENLDESSHKSNDPSLPSVNFDCSICLELPHDPVVTMCGHLFCWSCLHRWITIQPVFQECPVCKACVKDKIIPLYGRGRGGVASSDTRTKHSFNTPRRPSAQQSYVPAANTLPSTAFQHQSFVSQEMHGNRGGHSMHSVTASGLLPALFGIHMITPPEYSGSLNASSRWLGVATMAPQHQRLNVQHESVLYWFLFLLGCFTSVCLLFF